MIRLSRVVAPVPPEVTARADASVRTPALEKLDVAVEPKYAGPNEEKRVVEAEANVERPVKVGVAIVGLVFITKVEPVPV